MPTKKQLSRMWEAEFEFPQIRREDDPGYKKSEITKTITHMESKEIESGNKLIANFDSAMRPDPTDWKKESWYRGFNWIHLNKLEYHSSWDWQVPVMAKAFHECRRILTADKKDIYRENIRTLSDEWMKAALNNELILGFGWLVYCIKLIHEYNSQPNQQTPKVEIK
jgi:hypothetical protein